MLVGNDIDWFLGIIIDWIFCIIVLANFVLQKEKDAIEGLVIGTFLLSGTEPTINRHISL